MAEQLGELGVLHKRPDFLRAAAGDRDLPGPLERFIVCGNVDDRRSADGLRVRALGHQ